MAERMSVGWRGLIAAACLWGWIGAGAANGAQPLEFPLLKVIKAGTTGQAAVAALGNSLPAVAAYYGRTPEQLRAMLLSDPSLHLDGKGQIYVVEPEPSAALLARAAAGKLPWADGALFPLDQTFLLHSKPGAEKSIQLKFDGMQLGGTDWATANQPLEAKPFDIDGQPDKFSEAELTIIQRTWQRVAEDYAPFDVDVTTQAISADKLARADAKDTVFGTIALITPNIEALNCLCSGVSYLNSFFGPTKAKPALIMYRSSWGKFIGEMLFGDTATHELGHTLGLRHDGTATEEVYGGHENWQPIMGSEFWRPLSQFSKGEYAAASNTEDDFAVMQRNGLPLRLDDVGNATRGSKRPTIVKNGSSSVASFQGIIGAGGDRDVFSLPAGLGLLSARVEPAAHAPNADLVLRLLDPKGEILASSNPVQDLGAGIDFSISKEGIYFLAVEGGGEGDPLRSGYSSYGSVGAYRLSAYFTTRGSKPPASGILALPESGAAPLLVRLNGGSASTRLKVTSYSWDFGDGSDKLVSSSPQVEKMFDKPGTFSVNLTVADAAGSTETYTRQIFVTQAAAAVTPKVGKVETTLRSAGKRGTSGRATVTVVDTAGKSVPSAMVVANWSGAVSGTVSGKTRRNGTLVLNSPRTQAAGCFRLTVTSIMVGSMAYGPGEVSFGEACP